jgi:hypothetical protein
LTAGGVYGVPAVSRFHNRVARDAQAAPAGLPRLLAQFMAGASMGAVAGYGSHLVADAGTPKSIPLLGIKSR